MKKHISNHLRMATIVMGITLASSAVASAVAHEDNKGSKANDLLCVAIEGVESNKSALAVLRVEKNGQARGALCYLASLQDTELADCLLVDGVVLQAPGSAKAVYVGLDGTGTDVVGLLQTHGSATFKPDEETGKGAAVKSTVKETILPLRRIYTGLGNAYQGACRYDQQTKSIVTSPMLRYPPMGANPYLYKGPNAFHSGSQ